MSQIPELVFLLMIFTSVLNFLPIVHCLTLDMFRRDSFDFDLFPKNLSDYQKNQIFAQLSHSRAQHLSNPLQISVNNNGSMVQPPIKQFMESMFAVSLAIGSRPYNTYLVLDTGSDVTWVQCQGCKNGKHDCFKIKHGPFNHTASSSYRPIPFDDHLCKPQHKAAESNDCRFDIEYGLGHAMGVLARESLHFRTSKRNRSTIPDIVLGCADIVKKWTTGEYNDGPNNMISGIFGLSLGPKYGNSFMELTEHLTKMKFSYCLTSWNASKTKQMPLSFGDDVPRLPPSALSTPMDNSMYYYLNIYDISVGGHRLHLNPSIFRRRENFKGGLIIDSGCAMTSLVKTAYEKVGHALATILDRHGKRPVEPPRGYTNMFCYKWPLKIKNPPSVTYHLQNNADIVVHFEDMFYKERVPETKKDYACLTLQSVDDGEMSILGAVHQGNYRFVYDLNQKTLHFHQERC